MQLTVGFRKGWRAEDRSPHPPDLAQPAQVERAVTTRKCLSRTCGQALVTA
jgi:hypothetical protein